MSDMIHPWLAVYVPRPGRLVSIARGSGIVGTPDMTLNRIRIDYEGNLYDAVNLRTWRERVQTAADRHRANYPTIARALVSPDDVIYVGAVDDAGHIDLIDEDDMDTQVVFGWPPDFVSYFKAWVERPE